MTRNPSAFDRSGYVVRRARTPDIEAIIGLTETIPTVARWSRAAYGAYCVADQAEPRSQVQTIFVSCLPAAVNPGSRSVSGEILGFAAFSAVSDLGARECELENMAVAEEWRRRGIGRRLLEAGTLWCRTWCSAAMPPEYAEVPYTGIQTASGVWLEVRPSNRTAIAFYERAGFTAVGRRPAYYAQPTEDAVLMRMVFDAYPAAC